MQQNEHSFRLPLHHNPAEVTTMSMTKDGARLDIEITIQPQPFSGFFDAFFGCLQLCASDRPLRDAAIALIELGAPPEAMLTAWHVSGRRQEITTMLGYAAEGLDLGFDVENVVLPFRRRGSATINPGGDAA